MAVNGRLSKSKKTPRYSFDSDLYQLPDIVALHEDEGTVYSVDC